MQARNSISVDTLEDISDDEMDELLDEIGDGFDTRKLTRTDSLKIHSFLHSQIHNKRKINRRVSFTALKDSVFNELEEQDFVEQERISWNKLQQWIEFEWFDKLYQDNSIKQHYLNDIKEAKISYKSYTDKILIKYFKCPFKANKSNQSAQAFITNTTNDDAFIHFNFPYYFPQGLHHYLLFSRYDIINSLGPKQMKRLISHYIDNEHYENYRFIYYEERDKASFFATEQYEFEKKERVPLLSEIVDINIIPNIIHIFIMVEADYRVYLGANNATWADQSFLWEEACNIIKSKQIQKFGREEKWLRKYVQDRNKGKKGKKGKKNGNNKEEDEEKKQIGFNSIRDKILIKEFKCKTKINTERNKLMAIVDETTPRLLWTENLYPYFLETGIEHNLIWYLDEKIENDVVEAFIEKHIGKKREYIFWENPLHLKSIPDLDHVQVMSVDMNQYMADIKQLKYINKPYEWKEFINNDDIINKHECDIDYGWNERVCRRYLEENEETKIRFNSVFDADLRRYFKCKLKKDVFGKFIVDNDENNDDNDDHKQNGINYGNYDYKKYIFEDDRYHFHLQEGLKQYILIIRDQKKWENNKIKEIIKAELAAKLEENSGNKFVFWEKLKKQQASNVNNLWYYHVIYNGKNDLVVDHEQYSEYKPID